MEYANSGDLSEVAPMISDPEEILRLFSEIFDAICYLHERNVLHCDIKPTNILINRDLISGAFEAKLGDLGVSKPLGEYTTKNADLLSTLREETYLWGTPKYAPPYAADFLNQSRILMRTELRSYLPHYDLYCLGATLAETLSSKKLQRPIGADLGKLLESPKECFRRRLTADQWDYLCDFIRLLLQEDRAKGYQSATDARDAFARLDPQKAIPTRVPEISTVGSKRLITYGEQSVRLSERAYRIIAHPNFQRLQRLNQLNLIDAIYPEARQSRFSHSLEAYQFAKQAAAHLLGDGTFRLHVSARDLGMFLIATLLHDIGHYPLAHTMEDLRAEITDPACRPLADYDTVAYFLNQRLTNHPESIADLLDADWSVSVDEVARIVAKGDPETIPESIFQQLLDGPIDLDKLAYLTRDSRFTGVAYGRGIDAEALISALRLFSPTRFDVDRPTVGLAHKGIIPAESMIVARYHMFSRVYWHHTNRALMAMVGHVMKSLFKTEPAQLTFHQYLEQTHGLTDIEALRLVSEKFDRTFVCAPGSANQSLNPLHGLLDGSRNIYKRLVSFSSHPKSSRLAQCQMFLGTASQTVLGELAVAVHEELSKLIGRALGASAVLFDVPRMNKEKDTLTETIVSDPSSPQGRTQLNEISKVVGAVFTDFQWLAKKSRIFIDPALRAELRSRDLEQEAAKSVENIVSRAARRHQ